MSIITVLTDFGSRDPYVGIMKGVMLGINPHLHIVDMTHEVEAQDVGEAAFLIGEYFPYFPRGTIHLCVVDPTVGSARKPLIVVKDGHIFVGPDNGIFSLLFAKGEAKGLRDHEQEVYMGKHRAARSTAVISLPRPRRTCRPASLRQNSVPFSLSP